MHEEEYLLSRSKLYSLEPIGLHTAYTESLTSYITRISEVHSVNVSTLFKNVLAPILNKNYISDYSIKGGNGFFDWSHTLNGIGTNANDFTNALSELTCRKDVIYMTLIPFKDVIPTKSLSKDTISWCPYCFEEWKNGNKPVYIPLVWCLKVVELCDLHGSKLENVCTNCNNKVPFLHRKSRNGYCPRCKAWLGRGVSQISYLAPNVNDYEKWTSTNVGELISAAPELNMFPFREKLTEKLSNVIKELSNISELSNITKIPKSTILGWAKGAAIPPLDKLLLLAYILQLKLTDFLINSEALHNKGIKRIDEITLRPIKANQGRKKYDYSTIVLQLEMYLNIIEPISMTKVAEIIGADRRGICRRFPDLCKQISERYKDYMNQRSILRKTQVEAVVDNAIQQLITCNEYPSRRKIELNLPSRIILKDGNCKSIWKSKLKEYKL